MSDQEIEQAIRRSHCAHAERDDPDHGCAGTCTITPKGVTLECSLCGDDFEDRHPYRRPAGERAQQVVEAAGIQWVSLSDRAKQRAAEAIERTMCPGCGQEKPTSYRDYHTCGCGAYAWSEWSGWSETEKTDG